MPKSLERESLVISGTGTAERLGMVVAMTRDIIAAAGELGVVELLTLALETSFSTSFAIGGATVTVRIGSGDSLDFNEMKARTINKRRTKANDAEKLKTVDRFRCLCKAVLTRWEEGCLGRSIDFGVRDVGTIQATS